jgi:hypothetical protein
MKPAIKRLVHDIFAGVHYTLTQQEYDELVVEEVVTRRFAVNWDAIILPFRVLSSTILFIIGRSDSLQFPKSIES